MSVFVSKKPQLGRPRKLSRSKVDLIVARVDRAKKGGRLKTYAVLAERFDCHWRTIENAYRQSKKVSA